MLLRGVLIECRSLAQIADRNAPKTKAAAGSGDICFKVRSLCWPSRPDTRAGPSWPPPVADKYMYMATALGERARAHPMPSRDRARRLFEDVAQRFALRRRRAREALNGEQAAARVAAVCTENLVRI